MTALIKTLLPLGTVVLATAGQLIEDYDEEDTAITQSGSCHCQATVYENTNYGGRSLVIKHQNANFINNFFNDKVDSIKISGTCNYLFHENTEFNGETYLLKPGNYPSPQAWGGRGDKISSARALPPAGTKAIAIFEHHQFSGPMVVLYRSQGSLPNIEFNDKISSEIVTGGKWTLYEHASFKGVSVTRTTGQYPTHSNLMDRVSSIKYIPSSPPTRRRQRKRWNRNGRK